MFSNLNCCKVQTVVPKRESLVKERKEKKKKKKHVLDHKEGPDGLLDHHSVCYCYLRFARQQKDSK